MGNKVIVLSAAAVLALAPMHSGIGAPDYPSRPVRIITQGAAGSGPDVIARLVADELGRRWRQQVLIVNHPGGGGVMAARAAAAAEADGHTLYIPTVTSFVIMPEMQRKLALDMMRDFAHIGLVAETPMMFGVAPAIGVDSLRAFVELSKKRPGSLFYAANNRGSFPHLTGELFRTQTNADVTFVPYPGAAAGLQDLMGGRIAMIVESVGALTGAIQSGSIKPLGVASDRRLPNLPDIPAVAETVPGFQALGWFVLSAPAKVPAEIVQKVSQDLNDIIAQPTFKQKLLALGAYARSMGPKETSLFIRDEDRVWRPLVRQIGLAAE